nr:hypothetical protein [Tanacetum cinerariifolium]
MSSITAQQAKLNLELVPKEKRLEIRKCNGRLKPGKIQGEPTFQVVLDALALNPCYFIFLITADVPKVYMHQFWDSVYKHDTFYRFKIDKRKRFKLTLKIIRDIFKILPRVQGQDFDALPTDEEVVSFLRELRYTGEINSLNDVVVDHMYQSWRTFAALINKSLSGKKTAPTGKSKRVKRPAKKSTETPARGVVIRETPEMPLTKKKEKVDVTREKDSDDDKTQSDNELESNSEHETNESELGSESNHNESEENKEDETKITDKAKGDEDEETDYTTSQLYNDVDITLNEPIYPDEGFVQEEESNHNESEENKEDETKITDKAKGGEDEETDYTTSQLYNDVDIRLNEPVFPDEGFVQEEGTDAAIIV